MAQDLIWEPNAYYSAQVITLSFHFRSSRGAEVLQDADSSVVHLRPLHTAVIPTSPFESSSPGTTTAGTFIAIGVSLPLKGGLQAEQPGNKSLVKLSKWPSRLSKWPSRLVAWPPQRSPYRCVLLMQLSFNLCRGGGWFRAYDLGGVLGGRLFPSRLVEFLFFISLRSSCRASNCLQELDQLSQDESAVPFQTRSKGERRFPPAKAAGPILTSAGLCLRASLRRE